MCMWCVIQYKWTYARTHVLCPQSHNMAAIYTMVHYDCKTSKIIIGFTNGWYVSSLGQTSCGTKSTYAVVWPRFTVCVKPISGTIASAFVQYNMWCVYQSFYSTWSQEYQHGIHWHPYQHVRCLAFRKIIWKHLSLVSPSCFSWLFSGVWLLLFFDTWLYSSRFFLLIKFRY